MDLAKEQLLGYITEQLKLGANETVLVNAITANGWTAQDYAELSALAKVQLGPTQAIPPEPIMKTMPTMAQVSAMPATPITPVTPMRPITPITSGFVSTQKPKSGFGKIFLILVFLIMIGSGIAYGYMNKDIILQIPVVKSLAQQIGLVSAPQTVNTQTQDIPVATTTDTIATSTTQVATSTDVTQGTWRTFKNDGAGVSISFPNTFKAADGVEDFTMNSSDGLVTKNSEYFCDGECPKGLYPFGLFLSNELVNQKLIDSWSVGGEIKMSKHLTLNGRDVWVVEDCAMTGCGVSFMYNRKNDRVQVTFGNSLLDTKNDLLISDLAQQILKTLVISTSTATSTKK